MSGVMTLLKRTWVDWAVFGYMVVTAARCKSPIAAGLFTVFAVVVAVLAVRKSWQLVQLAGIATTPSPREAEATHHRS
ncbi:hypothetical protein [Streptomyces sp. NPDC006551]|uniref:hypothetical protein n=1 Tax=Streptomyces sp. NPDC006551 TaxID=3157178 RepID=UPI0033A8C91E